MLDFVEARLSKLSGSSGIVGHLIPPSDIESSIKDGANELALPSSIEVDELEKSSTTGISASARSLHSISDSASTLCPSGETTTMLLESGILMPAKCLDQIHQHYSYPAGQTNPEGLCSIDDGYIDDYPANCSARHTDGVSISYVLLYSVFKASHSGDEEEHI